MATTTISNIIRGDTLEYKFNFGAGVDVNGWKIFMTLKRSLGDLDNQAYLAAETTAGQHFEDELENGIIVLRVESSDTEDIPPREYYYDFQRVNPAPGGTDVKTILIGRVSVVHDVTLRIV